MSGRANVNKKGTLLSPMITYLCLTCVYDKLVSCEDGRCIMVYMSVLRVFAKLWFCFVNLFSS